MGAVTGGDPPADTKEEVRREQRRFRDEVAAKEKRRRRARREGDKGFWFGLASFGSVGWSIAVPTVLGALLGSWLDARLGGGIRYTLSLLVLGLAIGANNVWRWFKLQEQEAEDEDTAGEPSEPPHDSVPPGKRGGDL